MRFSFVMRLMTWVILAGGLGSANSWAASSGDAQSAVKLLQEVQSIITSAQGSMASFEKGKISDDQLQIVIQMQASAARSVKLSAVGIEKGLSHRSWCLEQAAEVANNVSDVLGSLDRGEINLTQSEIVLDMQSSAAISATLACKTDGVAGNGVVR